ncbi:MAG: FkbM family methyltransferase [Rhodospirillaceae bacterium]|nr:FkbM family methyltransferase [Rhodospirillales bacterium]
MSLTAALRRFRHGPLKFLGPVWRILGRAYRAACRLGLSGPKAQKIGPYGPFLLQPQFAFSDFENWGGAHNGGFTECVEACRGADCVLDVGGHIGLLALPMASAVGAGGRVYTFEPSAANCASLKAHVALNKLGNVDVINAMVGETDHDAVTFYEHPGVSGRNGMAVRKNAEDHVRTTRPQVSLDSFCGARNLSPRVIKIDVEGAEVQVLRGARALLERARPMIFLSVHPAELKLLGSSVEELAAEIEKTGYQCREMDGSPIREFRLREYLLLPRSEETPC